MMLSFRSSPSTETNFRRRNTLRELAESALLLALAVLLFRTFAVEGYLISTGSMAPTLLGYHRRVECPACHFAFTRGAAFDKSQGSTQIASANFEGGLDVFSATKCPNCSLGEINARVAPRNEGDQLLVQKLAYEFRDPRRWEVVVFQNQNDAEQAYVKRAVGLPGESLQLRSGDLYINDELQRKPFEIQQAMRVPVSDYFHQPEDQDPDWRSRWAKRKDGNDWNLSTESIHFRNETVDSQSEMQWFSYENWIRSGGEHETRVPISSWPSTLKRPDDPRLRYENGELICLGTFSAFEKQQWLQKCDEPNFQAAIEKLFTESHIAPIVDAYGYNSYDDKQYNLQHDLMVSVEFSNLTGPGQFEIQLTDGAEAFRVVILPDRNEIALLKNNDLEPLWRVPFQAHEKEDPIILDFSLFDQQVVVAVNETLVHSAISYTPSRKRSPLRRPVRIGAVGIDCEITGLHLSRDVYYTMKGDDPDKVYQLNPDEFFVLGDNSPVSLDSRVWTNPAVPRSALIGKPFVVHLPSRQGEFQWKGKVSHVRVPDFSRIRYIR